MFAAFLVVLLGGAVLAPAAAASAVNPPPGAVAVPAAPSAGGASVALDPYDPKNFKVAIHESPLPFKVSANYVTVDIVITLNDHSPISRAYGVYLTFNEKGKDATQNPAKCEEAHYNEPEIPRGLYRCTGIITHPGVWQFHGTIDKPGNILVPIATVQYAKNFTTAEGVVVMKMKTEALKYIVEGKTFEVFLLQSHVILAGAWLLLAASMAFLALPRLRRTLSVLTLHTLEVRRGFLVSLLGFTFGGTVITGLYLLTTQTAYKAPYSTNSFSKSAWDSITRLPYAQDYFLLLYGKILIFGVMAAASVVLVMEAGRQAQLAQDTDALDRDEESDLWTRGVSFDEDGRVLHDDRMVASGPTAGAGVATALPTKRRTSGSLRFSPQTLWTCVWILIVGAASIGMCVTGLKYLHELIESTIAATVLGAGGG
jgi:hypothetical protein